jgi:hypothetical protein
MTTEDTGTVTLEAAHKAGGASYRGRLMVIVAVVAVIELVVVLAIGLGVGLSLGP